MSYIFSEQIQERFMKAIYRWAVGVVFWGAGSFAFAQTPATDTPTGTAPQTAPAPTSEATTQAPPALVIPPNDTSRVGTFKHVEGDAWLGRTTDRQRLRPGDGVRENAQLSTGANGAASVVLKDGTVLTMGPNTTVDLRRFRFDSTTQEGHFALDLLKGSVRVITGLLARINPELFKVHTPTSVVGVRGTDFIVEASEPM
jgi:ferric-dicitrate binding protein FerR (iron transport regulator)